MKMAVWFLVVCCFVCVCRGDIVQFALGYGDFMCMYIDTLRCYRPITNEKDPGYCTSYESVLSCLQEHAVRCNVDNTTVVQDMQKMIKDVCQEGSELNKEYKKHESCYREANKAESTAKCFKDFREATVSEVQSLRGVYLREFKTSDDARAELVGELSCEHMWGILQCSKDTMNKTCGDEATKFFQKVQSPKEHFMRLACVDEDEGYYAAAALTFPTSWLLALTASWAVLKFFRP